MQGELSGWHRLSHSGPSGQNWYPGGHLALLLELEPLELLELLLELELLEEGQLTSEHPLLDGKKTPPSC